MTISVAINTLTTTALAALTADDVSGLTATTAVGASTTVFHSTGFGLLTSVQLALIPTAALVAIDTSLISKLTSTAIPGLTTVANGEIQALTVGQVAALTSVQTVGLTTAQINVLPSASVEALSSAGVKGLTAAAFSKLVDTNGSHLTADNGLGVISTQMAALSSTQVIALDTVDTLRNVATVAVPGIVSTAIPSLAVAEFTAAQFGALTTAQLSKLTADVFDATTGAVTTPGQISAISAAQIEALSSTQTAGLSTAQVHSLDSAQVGALTSSGMKGLTAASFPKLADDALAGIDAGNGLGITSAQVATLSSAQVALLVANSDLANIASAAVVGIPSTMIQGLGTAVADFTPDQFASLTTAQISKLAAVAIPSTATSAAITAQIPVLTPDQLAKLTTAQAAVLNSAQVGALDSVQVHALDGATVAKIPPAAFAGLSLTAIGGLDKGLENLDSNDATPMTVDPLNDSATAVTSAQIAALSSDQVHALSSGANNVLEDLPTAAFLGLTTANIAGLIVADLPSVPDSVFKLLTPEQKAALSADQLATLTSASIPSLTANDFEALLGAEKLHLLTSVQLAGLTPTQASLLTAAQLDAMTALPGATAFASISVDALAGLNGFNTVTQLSASYISLLNAAKVTALGANDDLQYVSDNALAGLTAGATGSIKALDFSKLAADASISLIAAATLKDIDPSQVAGIQTAQIHTLTSVQTALLTDAQLRAFSPDQITALEGVALKAIPAATLAKSLLTTDGTAVAPGFVGLDENAGALTSTHIQALSPAQITALGNNDDLKFLSVDALKGLATTATVTGTVPAAPAPAATISIGDAFGVTPASYTPAVTGATPVSAFYTLTNIGTTTNVIAASTLNLGDALSFTGAQSLTYNAAPAASVTAITDGQYALVRGSYTATGTKFAVSAAGLDTLVLFDKDATGTAATSSFVVTGIAPTAFTTSVADKFTVNTGTAGTIAAHTAQVPSNITGLDVGKLSNDQLAALSDAQFKALGNTQVGQITAEQAPALSIAQAKVFNAPTSTAGATPSTILSQLHPEVIGALTGTLSATTNVLGAIEAVAFASLSRTQFAALGENAIGITSAQIAKLSPVQITALATNDDLQFIDRAAFAGLATTLTITIPAVGSTPASTVASNITGLVVSKLLPDQFSALTPAHLSVLSEAQVHSITLEQVVDFTLAQVKTFPPAFVHNLSAEVVGAFTQDQIELILPDAFKALSDVALAGLDANAAHVTAGQIKALSAGQITALGNSGDLAVLAPDALIAGLTAANIAGLDVSKLTGEQFDLLTPLQFSLLNATLIDSVKAELLDNVDITAMKPAEIGHLSAAVIPSLSVTPSTGAILGFTSKNIGGLNGEQIGALTEAQMAALTADAIKGLTPAQAGALTGVNFAAIGADLVSMQPAALAAILPAEFASITPAQVHILSPAQVDALLPAQIHELGSAQTAVLDAAQVAKLGIAEVNVLSSEAIAGLDEGVINKLAINAGFTADQVAALTPAQVAQLLPAQLGQLDPDSAVGITPEQVNVLTLPARGIANLSGLTAIAAVTPEVIAALDTIQLDKLTPAQIGALTDVQVVALHHGTSGSSTVGASSLTDQLGWVYGKGYTTVTSAHDVTSHSIETTPTVNVTVPMTAGTRPVPTYTDGAVITAGLKATNITGTANNDTIIGGGGADTIRGGAGADILTGDADSQGTQMAPAAGADKFLFDNTSTGLPSATNFDTIVDFTTSDKDTIAFPSLARAVNRAAVTDGAGNTAKIQNGVATFATTDTTLQSHINAVAKAQITAGAATIWKEDDGSFIFISDNIAGASATDVLIKLDGLEATGVNITSGVITGIVDIDAPAVTLAAGSTTAAYNAEGVVVVKSDEVGSVYLLNSTSSKPVKSGSGWTFDTPGTKSVAVAIEEAGVNTNLPVAGLTSGSYVAYAVDNSGNLSVVSPNKIVVDTVAPATPTIATAKILTSATVMVESAEAGVKPYLVNTSLDGLSVTELDAAVSGNQVNTATAFGATVKKGTVAATALEEGEYKAYTVDAVGNVSDASVGTITIDLTAPELASAVTLTVAGTIGTGITASKVVADAELRTAAVNAGTTSLTVTAAIAAGDAAGGYAELLINTNPSGTTYVSLGKSAVIGGATSLVSFPFATAAAVTAALKAADGGGEIVVKLVDKAGNISYSAGENPTLTIDKVAPVAASAVLLKPVVESTVAAGSLNEALNLTSTNFKVTATVPADAVTDGAELWIGGVLVTPVTNTLSGSTLTFNLDTADNGALQALIADSTTNTAGDIVKAVVVKLFDAAGNASLSTVKANLLVDYIAPATPNAPAELLGTNFDDNGINAVEGAKGFKINAGLSTNSTAVAGDKVELLVRTTADQETPDVVGTARVLTLAEATAKESLFPVSGATTFGSSSTRLDATDGEKFFSTRVTDKAGNVSAESSHYSVGFDKTAPTGTSAPNSESEALADVLVSKAEKDGSGIVINVDLGSSGAVEGDSVQLLLGGKPFASAKTDVLGADGGATFTFTAANAELGLDGLKSLTAVVTDVAGNVGAASSAFTFTVDTAKPTPAAAPTTTNAVKDGINAGELGAPIVITANLAKTGAALGDTVELLLGTNVIATSTPISGSVPADKAFTITAGELGNEGVQTFTTRVVDKAGNVGDSSAPLLVNLDTVAPNEPALPTANFAGVALSADGIVNGTKANEKLTIHASLGADVAIGDTVSLLLGGVAITGGAVAGLPKVLTTAGVQTYDFVVPRALLGADGEGKGLSVVVTDKAGNTGGASAPVIVTLDTTAPTVNVSGIAFAPGEGVTGQLPEVTSGAVNHFNAGAGNVAANGDVVLITVPFNDVVHVTGSPTLNVAVGSVVAKATYVEGSDTNALVFKYTVMDKQLDTDGINIPANALVLNGGTITDISGNPVVLTTAATNVNANFVVDAVAPIAAVAPAGKAGATGATGADILANGVNAAEAAGNIVIRAPLSSSAEVNDKVELFLDGVAFDPAQTVTLDATAVGSTVRYVDFTVAGNALGADNVAKLFTTKTTDVAGNVSVASPALKFVLDTVAPTDPAIALTDSGVTDDFITNNKVVTVTGIAGEAATTIWEYTLDKTPAGLGDVVNLASSATSNGISFSEGTEVITGIAGSTAETQTVALSGTATGEAAVNFLGVATASVASAANATTVGDAIVTAKAAIIAGAAGQAAGISDISNNAGTLTITYKAAVSWVRGTSSGLVSLPDDTYAIGDFAVRRTDAAGNVSEVVSNPEEWTIDTVKPTLTVGGATTINGAGHATVTPNEVGNAYLVLSSAISTPMTETAIKSLPDTSWNTAAVSTKDTATDVPATGLTDGAYKLFVADVAGNLSSASTATITVDNVDPTATALGVANSTTLRGTSSEAGSLVLVKADGSALTNAVTAGTFTASALTKTVTVVAQTDASGTAATLKVLDTAGNEATASAAVILGTTGANTLTSTAAKEFMFGLGNNDKFVFATADVDTNGLVATDVIADFTTGDKLILGTPPAEGSAYVAVIPAANETANVTFPALANNDVFTLAGVTVTATASVTGATLAAAFQSKANGATISGTGFTTTGALTDYTSTTLSNTDHVVFTSVTQANVTDLAASAVHIAANTMAPTLVITQGTASPTVTESANITFHAMHAGDSFVLAGITATATATLTSIQVATAFASSGSTGGTVASGVTGLTLNGTSLTDYTAAPITSTDHVVFTSTTANTNVADLALTSYNDGSSVAVAVVDGTAGAVATGNYVEASAAVVDLTTLLGAADTALAGTVKYYVGQVTGGSTYVVTDTDGTGHTDVIELVGVALSGIAFGDIVAS